eukprot:6103087-Pleurochrysis_carterae.AAC.1
MRLYVAIFNTYLKPSQLIPLTREFVTQGRRAKKQLTTTHLDNGLMRVKCHAHAMRVQWRRVASRNGGRTPVLCTSGEEWRREKRTSRTA